MPEPTHPSHPPSNTGEPAGSVSDVDETTPAESATDEQTTPHFPDPIEPGDVGRLGPYRVVRQLGRGGMGAVYLGIDTRLDRKVALKVMLPQFAANVAAKERFIREARAAARVGHDNVVTVYEADERDGIPYIAMQFLQGYPLNEYLRRKENLALAQVVRVGRETAAGLAAAHAIGLVHRDIKPANLWLEAPNGRVKVLDFGLARPVDTDVELTRSGAVVGTPAFMSPEQARGERVDARSDLFSLGAVLYRLCTGRLPFPGSNTMAVLMALGTQEPAPVRGLNPEVPEPLAALIHQLLAKDPAARPQTADEVVRCLDFVEVGADPPMALPADDPSFSLPQVVYVPIQVTVLPETDAFADLGETEVESAHTQPAPAAKPVRKKPGGTGLWAVAGVAVVLAAALAFGVYGFTKNKDRPGAKGDSSDGSTPARDKTGKTVPPVGSGPKTPIHPDRRAAEWVLSCGGTVQVNGDDIEITAAAQLPAGPFTLTSVELYDNTAVTDDGLANLKDCGGLANLDLGYTRISNAGLAHLKGCTGLTTLNIRGTKITDAGLENFKNCTSLKWLILAETALTDAGLAHFKECRGLILLDVYRTAGVTDKGLAYFKDLRGLTSLHLGGKGVTNKGLREFTDLSGLTVLGLYDTSVTEEGLARFKGCTGLTRLVLNDMPVSPAGLENFKGCTRLRILSLYGSNATDEGLANFKACKGLTELYLHGTSVTDDGLAYFRDCKGLGTLTLTGTKVTAEGVEKFHAAVPGCKIEWDGGTIEPKK